LSRFEQHDHEIDLVVSDILMPGMTGPELVRRMLASRGKLKVVYVSGCADSSELSMGSEGVEIAYLPKPVRPDVLAATVRRVLDAAQHNSR
jgi:two-component system cell cycle sensor histidine kinase/response regulator CckA